jgi:hypothetical protein
MALRLRGRSESDPLRMDDGSNRGCIMLMRVVGALVILMAFSPAASAGGGIIKRVSCTVVRFYVEKYSVSTAEMWARGHGATDAEIEAARRCLKDMPTQSAQAAHWWTQ